MIYSISSDDKIINLAREMKNAEDIYFNNSGELLATLKKLYAMPIFKMENKWFFITKCPYVKPKIKLPEDNS